MTTEIGTIDTCKNVTQTLYSALTHPLTSLVQTPRSSGSDAPLDPSIAAVEMIDEFKTLAAGLCPRDRSTQDDLVQEMCLTVLECKGPKQRSYFRCRAMWRAKDFLRWWRTPLSRTEEPQKVAADEIEGR